MPLSVLSKKTLRTPFNNIEIDKLIRKLLGETSKQATAATATEVVFAKQAGEIKAVGIIAGEVAAVGEDMTIDVELNGTTVLSAAIVYDDSSAIRTWYYGTLDPTNVEVAAGDAISIIRTYTAGGGPTPVVNTEVAVEIGPAK